MTYSQTRTLFLTCANEPYYRFAVPFMFSIFKTQSDALIEIFLNDKEKFVKKHQKSLNFIQENINPNFTLTEVSFEGVIPNTVRFVHEPTIKADFVYISDIDIFYTEKNITDTHLKLMIETGQEFSNIVRPNTTRLSGLHFSKWDCYYPIPNISLGKINDEMILYRLVKQKTGKEPRKDLDIKKFRPVHGIHTSPNRTIDGKVPWGINEDRARAWVELTCTPEWTELSKLLRKDYGSIEDEINAYIKRKYKL